MTANGGWDATRPFLGMVCACRSSVWRPMRLARDGWKDYIQQSHDLFEEIMLEGMIIGYLRLPIEEILALVEDFLPRIDNWSVCDSFVSGLKCTRNHPEEMMKFLKVCRQDRRPFHLRFVLVMLLNYYTENPWQEEALAMIESMTHKDYYVKMAKAWALSVFYHHAPEKVERILSREHDSFVYDKTLQKIIESNRSDAALREKIRKLRKQ